MIEKATPARRRSGPLVSPQMARLARMTPAERHVIDEVSYYYDYIVCACGWEGAASDNSFALHRRELVGPRR